MGLLLMAAAAWVFFLATIALASGAFFPLIRRRLSRLHPSSRSIALRSIAVAPVVVAAIGVLLCFAPKMLGGSSSKVDHCVQHGDGHPHFCLNHPPQVAITPELWVGLAIVGTTVLIVSVSRWSRFRRSARILGQLASTARYDARRRAWMVDTELPLAISVGILRTRTLVSSGLMQVLTPRLVEAILAHEHAHERRRDGLWKLATEALSVAHLPPIRRTLTADLEIACEQACDEEAGAALGDRVRVAEALVAMERLRQSVPELGSAAHAFGDHGLVARVQSLVSDSPGRQWARRPVFAAAAAVVAVAIAGADPLHHLTETVLHYVLG